MVNFDKFSSENTVIFADFSPKITVVRPKYVSWGSIQEGVLLTRIRYLIFGDFLRNVICTLDYCNFQFTAKSNKMSIVIYLPNQNRLKLYGLTNRIDNSKPVPNPKR